MEVKKVMVTIFFMLLFVSCIHWGQALLTDTEYSGLKQAAGDNWNIDEYGDRIVITSKRLFWFYNAVSLPFMTEEQLEAYIKENGRQDYYEITLRFVKRWTEAEVKGARKKNGTIYEAIDHLQEKHGLMHLTPNKMNSFFPETEEDEKKIEAYEKDRDKLLSQLIDIPTYYSEQHSIFVVDNRMGFEAVWNEDITLIDLNRLFNQH
jgi:hypothetical protein